MVNWVRGFLGMDWRAGRVGSMVARCRVGRAGTGRKSFLVAVHGEK